MAQWHVEEGCLLASGMPLFTLHSDATRRIFRFWEKATNLVLRKRVAAEGQTLTANDTLALVGTSDEVLPLDWESDILPCVGTARVGRKLVLYRNIIGLILLLLLALFALQLLTSTLEAKLTMLSTFALFVQFSFALALGVAPLLVICVGTLYILQPSPNPKRTVQWLEEAGALE